MFSRWRPPRAVIAPAGPPGWRAPNDLLEHLDTVTRERDTARALYAAAGAELDQLRPALAEALAEAAELRHLPEKVRLLEGSLTRARARVDTAHSAALRWAANRIDPGPGSDQPHERGMAVRLRLWADNNDARAISIADQIEERT